jgi:hypothetical protein
LSDFFTGISGVGGPKRAGVTRAATRYALKLYKEDKIGALAGTSCDF